MNKEEFLKKLEKKLNILSVEEREDTINEYRNIIDEKIARGKSEEEAVKEAGNIDELAKEILEAYKINPEYRKKDKTFAESTEEAIKKGAKKLSEMTEEVVDNIKNAEFEFTTQNVFEIVIKAILVLLVLALLKIPFALIGSLVTSIFRYGIFGAMTASIFKILIEFAYIAICLLILLTLIHKYTTKNKEDEPNYKEKRNHTVEKKENSDSHIKDIIIFIIKMFIVIVVVIPLFCVIIGLAIAIAAIVYVMCKGIAIYGILILTIGILGFVASLVSLIFAFIHHKSIQYYPFIISFIVSLVGGFMTIDYIAGFTYHDELDETRYHMTTKTFKETITKETDIYYIDELKIDDTLEDNQIVIDVTYSSKYLGVDLERRESEEETQLIITGDRIKTISINEDIIEDIKNQQIYNYSLLGYARVVVYVNTATAKYVR